MPYPDSKYSCWWALPSSKQFSWFCRTARIITLLSTLSFNCNIYYVHYLKCSTNPVPDVSCSSQNFVCLEVWLSGMENEGTCSEAGSDVLCWSIIEFALAISFSKNCSSFSSYPPDLPGLMQELLCVPDFSESWWCLLALLKNLKNCAVSKMWKQLSSVNESEVHLVWQEFANWGMQQKCQLLK